ncbi:hypothetical protein [Vibrio astriarenae]|uniref:hypothetical protein n=1 Tax=Vibrio astriarenae TaxID=1481923 RepID=UPI003734D8DD
MIEKLLNFYNRTKGMVLMIALTGFFYASVVIPAQQTLMVSDANRMMLKLGFCCLGLYFLARFFDWMNGVVFRDVVERINKDPIAAAFYGGARLIAIAIMLSGL